MVCHWTVALLCCTRLTIVLSLVPQGAAGQRHPEDHHHPRSHAACSQPRATRAPPRLASQEGAWRYGELALGLAAEGRSPASLAGRRGYGKLVQPAGMQAEPLRLRDRPSSSRQPFLLCTSCFLPSAPHYIICRSRRRRTLSSRPALTRCLARLRQRWDTHRMLAQALDAFALSICPAQRRLPCSYHL